MEGNGVKDSQHVRVYVRVRPLNVTEKKGRSVAVVECSGSTDVRVRERSYAVKPKTFHFDQVFGPDSKQLNVYQSVLSPMIDEVLCGYNCTVFAYGQTGSGKTFTMVGERSSDPKISWDVDPLCGLIPRALSHLFDKLVSVDENHVVRVSYLELYNEELIDLLSKNDDVPKLKLYEDSNRKGGIIVQGLEELEVSTKDEIYHILEKGSLKRQMAATLMNSQSSRSHTVFTITLHIKETLSNEEVLKTGRLNLVDLAGSENIGRSGSIDKRAREAGNINQSLLTLGRVITALTENAPHIPYRESKLTRLLQESLGGCTKTSIIATISPASSNLDETLSTLEYAFRARKITNKPEINQKLTRKALITEYTEEIERLRRDLLCNREKSGVYLGYDDYMQMCVNFEQLQEENGRKLATMAALNKDLKAVEELCNKLAMKKEKKMKKQQEISNCLSEVTTECYEKSHLLRVHQETERQLTDQTVMLQSVVSESASHAYKLHDKLSQVAQLKDRNVELCQQFENDAQQKLLNMENHIEKMQNKNDLYHTDLQTVLSGYFERRIQAYTSIQDDASSCLAQLGETLHECKSDNSKCVIKTNEGQQIVSTVREFESKSFQDWHSLLELAKFLSNQSEDDLCAVKKENEALRKIQWLQYLEQQNIFEQHNTLKKLMKEYQELELEEYLQMQQTLDYLLEQQLQLNIDLDSLDTHLEKVRKCLQTQTCHQNECASENKTLDAVKTAIMDMFDHQAEEYQKQSNIHSEQSKHVALEVGVALANMVPHLTSALENLSVLDVETSKVVKSNEALRKECSERSQEELNHLHKYLCVSQEKCLEHTKEFDDIVKGMVAGCTSVINQQKTDIVKTAEYCRENVNSHIDNMRSWSLEMSEEIGQRKNEVEKFVNAGLCRESRTGKTPERKEFHYPREIVSSSPDERILEKFRASESYNPQDAAVEAEKVSILESSSSGSLSNAPESSLRKSQKAYSTSNLATSSQSSELDNSIRSEPIFASTECDKENREESSVMHKTVNKHPKKIEKRILIPRN